MDNFFKLLGILFAFSLVAWPLTGCDNPPWEGASSLILKVDTPRDGSTVTTSTVTVSGRVSGTQSSGAKVKINGTDVSVKDRKFSIDVTLTEGKNVINIEATVDQTKLMEKVKVTYVPGKQ
ncbi:MAG: cadherin-like beta sandwich domain-containing protein [Deltaproteobacteria bacterium]|nr:cadherin-like beta sandwich domain-containing protein [Deltaproteobacteria bacterium]